MKTLAYLAFAAMGAFILPSCETTTSRSGSDSDWRRPPRYGSGSDSNNSGRDRRGSNRFGYSANDNASEGSSSRDRNEDKPEEKPKKEEEKKPDSNGGSSSGGNLKYAVKVPGKPLEVKLPGVNQPISIEKYDSSGKPTGEPLPPGTAVEIPDPNGGGGKIQFLVP